MKVQTQHLVLGKVLGIGESKIKRQSLYPTSLDRGADEPFGARIRDGLRRRGLDQNCSPFALNKLPDLLCLTSNGDMIIGHFPSLSPMHIETYLAKNHFSGSAPEVEI